MARRSRAREVALQLLYQYDLNPDVDRAVIERFARDRLRDAELVRFCLALYDGVRLSAREIDQRLGAAAENWRLPRMAAVDRNVLRLGAYEVLMSSETPAPVALDEAIELARRYSSKDSSAFVNGVLDRLHRGTPPPGKPAKTPKPAPPKPAPKPEMSLKAAARSGASSSGTSPPAAAQPPSPPVPPAGPA